MLWAPGDTAWGQQFVTARSKAGSCTLHMDIFCSRAFFGEHCLSWAAVPSVQGLGCGTAGAENSGRARIQYKNTHHTNRDFFSISFEVLASVFWAAGAGRRKVNYFLGGFNFNLLLGQKEEMQGKDSFSCTL